MTPFDAATLRMHLDALFLGVTLAFFSTLLFSCADALLQPTRLSHVLLGGLTVFWRLRMAIQRCFYSPALWRGNRFNTVAHYVFSAAWIYMTTVFAAALWSDIVRLAP